MKSEYVCDAVYSDLANTLAHCGECGWPIYRHEIHPVTPIEKGPFKPISLDAKSRQEALSALARCRSYAADRTENERAIVTLGEELERVRKDGGVVVEMNRKNAITSALRQDEIVRLREILSRITAEVFAVLGLDEQGLIKSLGIAHVEALKLRVREAAEELAVSPGEKS